MPSNDTYSIQIHVHTMTLADTSHEKKDQNTDNRTKRRVKKTRP